ncbi:unnamed protein product [Caenorhabditis sp. 36 PRJEB53466]|nr:unnamed protein product [Caenorhabditis sp. 36 PRJEB53466]
MRWVPILLVFVQVHSVPTRRAKIFMTSIDLDTNRKSNIDPEVVHDIGSELPPVKRNFSTQAPDYGDYDDYELTAKADETTTARPTSAVLDSQFKPHLKISLKSQRSSSEVRDEVSRNQGNMTMTTEKPETTTSVDKLLGNETMFFEEEEGSGEEGELLNLTLTTTRQPLLITTLIQEVKSVPVTERPDPYEHLDYDLSDHRNINKPGKTEKPDRLKKYKSQILHGGAVEPIAKTLIETTTVIGKPKRRKGLRKLNRIDKMKKVKYLNKRVRAQNRMRLRKVFSKMIFGSRDRVAAGHRSVKLKFVGSNGVVTPAPFNAESVRLNKIDSKTKRARRDKREVDEEAGSLSAQLQVLDQESVSAGGGWETVPIETNIIESSNYEPHPSHHLVGRTQVEPSPTMNEVAEEEEDGEEDEYSKAVDALPMRSGLVQVNLKGNSVSNEPRKLKIVALKSMKKVNKKERGTNGVALVAPSAKRPTMLELLIGDFLGRVPPTARSPYLLREQWS